MFHVAESCLFGTHTSKFKSEEASFSFELESFRLTSPRSYLVFQVYCSIVWSGLRYRMQGLACQLLAGCLYLDTVTFISPLARQVGTCLYSTNSHQENISTLWLSRPRRSRPYFPVTLHHHIPVLRIYFSWISRRYILRWRRKT